MVGPDDKQARIDGERRMLIEAQARGLRPKLWAYTRLSGPGWLQSAITLGGGSLTGSLYLGVLAGYSMLWLQILAMIMGVIMLSAIGYVTLATGQRPFAAINQHVNPVLGWGWAIASLMANMVWCLPQYSLGTAAVQQNLLPHVLGAGSAMGDFNGKLVIVVVFFLLTLAITWLYDSGGWGIKLYEALLKVMVAVIVICFFGVVIRLSLGSGGLAWGRVLGGLVPDLRMLYHPADTFTPFLDAVGQQHREFWIARIVSEQRDVMVTAAATAVGINMTFLLPYSMLARGWDRHYRGLAIFDLSTGMAIPFVLATGCVVIASASQFHTKPAPGLLGETDAAGQVIQAPAKLRAQYEKLLEARVRAQIGPDTFDKTTLSAQEKATLADSLPLPEKRMAAMLVRRDAFNLANALEPFTGRLFGNVIFGIGVLGMALSTITILMLISGFVVCEMLGLPQGGWPHRLGCLAAATGVLGPFIWSDVAAWAAVPTSVFGMILLPIAYITFLLLMNQKSLLGEHMPRGGRRLTWNLLMGIATALALFGSIWSVWDKAGVWGIVGIAVFLGLALVVHFMRPAQKPAV